MAITLVQEDGSGVAGANTYALPDIDADVYFEGHLYAAQWAAATTDSKSAALAMATRLIDTCWQFRGFRATDVQSLQWPRQMCPDPDGRRRSLTVLGWVGDNWLSSIIVPPAMVAATCEQARALLAADLTVTPDGAGVSTYMDATTTTKYDKSDTPRMLSRMTEALLAKYGTSLESRGGAVRLSRQ